MNELKEPQILTGLYTFVSGYVYGCASRRDGASLSFFGGREREEAAAAPHELLTGAVL